MIPAIGDISSHELLEPDETLWGSVARQDLDDGPSINATSDTLSDQKTYCPKNPDPSKIAILRTPKTPPAIQLQTLPLEIPRILRVHNSEQTPPS